MFGDGVQQRESLCVFVPDYGSLDRNSLHAKTIQHILIMFGSKQDVSGVLHLDLHELGFCCCTFSQPLNHRLFDQLCPPPHPLKHSTFRLIARVISLLWSYSTPLQPPLVLEWNGITAALNAESLALSSWKSEPALSCFRKGNQS